MIFVSTGSRKFQFDRLIQKLDELVGNGILQDTVFAQIAETTYIPKNFEYSRYLTPEEFTEHQNCATIVITHAGTGALIGALKKGKQVIAVPRLAKYGEHSDDHQLQVAEALELEGYLRVVLDMEHLSETIQLCIEQPIEKKYDKTSMIIPLLEQYIDTWIKSK